MAENDDCSVDSCGHVNWFSAGLQGLCYGSCDCRRNGLKHVIETNAYAAVLGNMNSASQLALAKEVAARGKAKRETLSQELNEKIRIVDEIAKEADRKAGVLEDFEKGQLEEALKKMIETNGMQALLDAVCLDLGSGQHFKLTSVMLALAKADKIVTEENTFDQVTGDLTEQKYTLADDSIVMMSVARINEENGDIRFNVTASGDAKWKGVDAGYHFIVRPIKATETIEGQPYEVVKRNDLVEKSNIVFDLTGQLVPCGDLSTDVDLNDDGVIGNTGTDTGGAGDGATL